jgi:hypothetical protein
VARNQGVVRELRDNIDREMVVPEEPHLVGALGAALMAPRKGGVKTARKDPVSTSAMEKEPFVRRFLRWST